MDNANMTAGNGDTSTDCAAPVDAVDAPDEQLPADACPGCGCRPGDGTTAGCTDPMGCGFWAAV